MNRPWDPEGKYVQHLLKEYKHWSLEISSRQRTLGAFFIFSKRDHERFSEMTEEETKELLVVMREMETALTNAFKPDRFNYLQLGNELHSLHFHGYPRYATERVCAGRTWTDETFTSWPNASREKTPPEVVAEIQKLIRL